MPARPIVVDAFLEDAGAQLERERSRGRFVVSWPPGFAESSAGATGQQPSPSEEVLQVRSR